MVVLHDGIQLRSKSSVIRTSRSLTVPHHGPAAHQSAPSQTPDCCIKQSAPWIASIQSAVHVRRHAVSLSSANWPENRPRTVRSSAYLTKETLEVVLLEPGGRILQPLGTDGVGHTDIGRAGPIGIKVLVHFCMRSGADQLSSR